MNQSTLNGDAPDESTLEADIAPQSTLPLGWKIVKLGDVAAIVSGQSPPSESYNAVGEGLPFLQGKAEFGEVYAQPTKFCTQPLKKAKADDVLISVRAPVGDVNLAPRECIIGRGLAALRFNDGDNFYLFFVLLYNQERIASLGSGTTFQSINKSTLDNFVIPFPPLSEQRAIASTLKAVQDAKEARRRELKLERERKAALMQHLFTYGTRGEPLKDTEIGKMPQSWEVVKLDELLKQAQYGLSLRGEVQGTYPILRMNCLIAGEVEMSNLQFVDLDSKTFAQYRLSKDDVLFNRTNSFELVGKTAIYEHTVDAVFASYLIRLTPDSTKLLPQFLNVYFNYGATQKRLKSLASRGVSQSNISAGNLRRFVIPLPPALEEQTEIAAILRACDDKIAALERESKYFDELFRALLEELMSGRLSVMSVIQD